MGNTQKEHSKQYSLRLTTNASKNITDIISYIEYIKLQPLNAIKVGDAFYATLDRIQKNPFSFRECEENITKSKKYRKAVCKSWLIIYKIEGNEIVILGILYASRNNVKIKKLRNIR